MNTMEQVSHGTSCPDTNIISTMCLTGQGGCRCLLVSNISLVQPLHRVPVYHVVVPHPCTIVLHVPRTITIAQYCKGPIVLPKRKSTITLHHHSSNIFNPPSIS